MSTASVYDQSAIGFDPGLNDRWREAVEAFRAYAVAQYPFEACGLILQDGSWLPIPNIAADPRITFEMAPAAVLEACGGYPAAVLHSHPVAKDGTGRDLDTPDYPSEADMIGQMATAVPWGISRATAEHAEAPVWFGDQVPQPPLCGRGFRPGMADCYALLRHWHLVLPGIKLKDIARAPEWWEEGGNLLLDTFEDFGFRRVDRGLDALPGDVFICTIRAKVPNHCGVHLGAGLILHHIPHRLSLRQPVSVWRKHATSLVLRHRDLPEDWTP